MAFLGVEFNDSAITAIRGDQIVFTEPGCAVVAGGQVTFGAEARRSALIRPGTFHDRYWQDLSEQRIAHGAVHFETHADLAHAQLSKLWQACAAGITEVGYAVPVYWSKQQLALLLGISEEAGIPVVALAEIPVAATRRRYPDHELVHIEVSTHATTLTRMTQFDAAAIGEREVLADLGVAALERTCADYVARRFLECSRFDPMHTADSEQSVYEQLAGWLEMLRLHTEAELTFTFKGNEFRATVSLADLAAWLRRRLQPMIQSLRARLGTSRPTALQVNSGLAMFPGVAAMLADLPGCDVFVLEPAAAARGLLQRQAHAPRAAALGITPSLPWDQPPADLSPERALASTAGGMPSHLVLDSHAWRLGKQPLRIGSEAAGGEYSLIIDARYAGVSRQHCSIELAGGRAVLNDHSRFGTRLNGHKIQGSAVLQPGDVLSIGDPPCELRLIAEVGAG